MKRLLRGLAYFWVLFTAAVWLYASAKALRDTDNTFGIGLVQATGRSALWVTVPAIAAALSGCILIGRKKMLGAWLLVAYGVFWGVALVGGTLKDAYEQFILGSEVYSRSELLQVLVVQFVLGTFFLLVALWAWRNRLAS